MVPLSTFLLGSTFHPEKRRGSSLSLLLSSGRVEREKIKDRRVGGYAKKHELGTYEVKMAERWYICYCEPSKALALVEALKECGAEAECPSFEFRRRVPRRNKVEVLERPLIGGIFFLGVDCWPMSGVLAGVDLSGLRRMMAPYGPAVIEDDELDGLRVASGDISRDRRSIYEGDTVEFCFGPFKGKRAKVVEAGKEAIKAEMEGFPGVFEVSSFLLRKIQE